MRLRARDSSGAVSCWRLPLRGLAEFEVGDVGEVAGVERPESGLAYERVGGDREVHVPTAGSRELPVEVGGTLGFRRAERKCPGGGKESRLRGALFP